VSQKTNWIFSADNDNVFPKYYNTNMGRTILHRRKAAEKQKQTEAAVAPMIARLKGARKFPYPRVSLKL